MHKYTPDISVSRIKASSNSWSWSNSYSSSGKPANMPGSSLSPEQTKLHEDIKGKNGNEIQVKDVPLDLERRSTVSKSILLITVYLSLEVAKQLGNYAVTTSNNDKMPIPSALLVLIIELSKLVFILFWAYISNIAVAAHGFSFKFGIPGLCYFLTNIIYLHSLTITAPPIWMILIQTRTLYTAFFYKLVFKREVTRLQIFGCVLIVLSIFLTRLANIGSGPGVISLYLLGISQIAAILSSIACLAVELLLKNDSRTFTEQQFWLYLWGATLGFIALLITESMSGIKDSLITLQSMPITTGFLTFATIASAAAGLCIPLIIRSLDSIVKDYLAALNNILLAILTAMLFPSHFPINIVYLFSLLVLILGIIMYERKTLDCTKMVNKIKAFVVSS